ncbi:MAG: hypothetical protein IJ011_06460 [Clostridia bacterium]|nr:hypothetical protein [Clostridia bacterium]
MAKREKNENVYDDGTYVVKKNRKESIIAFIICVLIAFAIWIYAKNDEIMKADEQPPMPSDQQTEQNASAEG